MSRPGLVPADIYAVKRVGVERWQKNFWSPISDSEFGELTESLLLAFGTAFTGLSAGRERDLLLCDFTFFAFLLQHLHYRALKTVSDTVQADFISGPLSDSFLRPDYRSLAGSFDSAGLHKGAFKFAMRRTAKRLRYNCGSAFTRTCSLLQPCKAWSLGSWSRLKEDYVLRHALTCDHPYVQTILRAKHMRASGFSKALEETIHMLVANAAERFEKHFGTVSDVKAAVACWMHRLRDLAGVYDACASGPVPEDLLLSEVARPLHKAIALGLRSKGARVIGFHHGNNMGSPWYSVSAYGQFASCDQFACPTMEAARFHARKYEKTGIKRMYPVEFISTETNKYAELQAEAWKAPAPAEVKTVMLMGYPMNANRYLGSPADWFFYQLDLELRIAEDLREQGFRVVYKMHPERREEAEGIFESLCDTVFVEPFERVWKYGDAYLFACTSTTTFGYALCLNRPVIVLDIDGIKWDPNAYDLLAKRCEMVPAWFGKGDRVEYDTAVLNSALVQARIPPDMSYVDRIMIPSRGNRHPLTGVSACSAH